MLGIVLPVGNLGATVYIDLTATPVKPSAPIASTRHPPPQRICRAEGKPGCDAAAADVSWLWVVVMGRGIRIRPYAIDNWWIVVGYIDGLRVCRLDRNDLPILRVLQRDLLLPRRYQLFSAVGLGSQALNGIHHIRLLCEHSVSQFLRPVEFGIHHREHRRRRNERLDAVIPALLFDLSFQSITS